MPLTRTLRSAIEAAATRLEQAGLSSREAAFDARLLARNVLSWDPATLLTRVEEVASATFLERYERLVARREQREPAAQVLGWREFWGRSFEITRDVLVPRPETELIVESALTFVRSRDGDPTRGVDVGTGSGCLAVTLALEAAMPMVATDISEKALLVARGNAHRLGAAVHLVRAHLLDGLEPGFDVIVANPPYVRTADRDALSPEVRDYEPEEALFGGPDGLDLIRALLDRVPRYLARDGRLLMEFGAGQDDRIAELVAERSALRLVEIRSDLQGIPRMAVIGRS